MRVLLFDANVLIDYFDADPTVFSAIRRSVGEIFVLDQVLREVGQLDAYRAAELGLQVYEPAFEHMAAAAARRGRLSFQDHLCLAVARAEGMTCITNDVALRSHCVEAKVEILWGLELLVLAVKQGGVLAADAASIGKQICDLNPRMGKDELARFLKALGRTRPVNAKKR